MKDNFVKLLIISLSHTTLITFLILCGMAKTSYNLGHIEYFFLLTISLGHCLDHILFWNYK